MLLEPNKLKENMEKMLLKNQRKDAIQSRITLEQFASAMKQANLQNIPPEKRKAAVIDHLFTIMSDTVVDSVLKYEIKSSQLLRKRLG